MHSPSTTRPPTTSTSSSPGRSVTRSTPRSRSSTPLERDDTLVNTSPYGEPQLGRRGLYRSLAGGSSEEAALLWVLSLSDGAASLVDVAATLRSAVPAIRAAADALLDVGLLRPAGESQTESGP